MTSSPTFSVNSRCPACRAQRIHSENDWINHPLRGHGFTPETGWTYPEQTDEDHMVPSRRGIREMKRDPRA
jgi:hypothetical protein